MDCSASMLLCSPLQHKGYGDHYGGSSLSHSSIPQEFIWPQGDIAHHADDHREELKEPVVDLEGFFKGDEQATQRAAKLVRAACLSHGFFQVVNHGVDPRLIGLAHQHLDAFFKMPIEKKLRAKKKVGSMWGYSGAHSERFSSKLPWKETLSFGYDESLSDHVISFFNSTLGKEEVKEIGLVFQKYCESMKLLSLAIMEVLGISLGVDRYYYKKFFSDGCSIMRCNYYPPCQEPSLALGTGPHCDPTSLTILHQDQVGGLEVLVNNKWHAVLPRQDALVINIGDTFSALTNGGYKSCLHRAVVNRYKERISLAFFVCPREDKVIKPPHQLLCTEEEPRKYPNFTWSDLLQFTQNHYRADDQTLQNFTQWLLASKTNNIN